MDEMAKKFGKHQIFFDFFYFYNKSSAGRLPPPNLVNQKIVWAAMCDSIGLPNSLIYTHFLKIGPKLTDLWIFFQKIRNP